VGWAGIAFGCSRADMGLARGACRAGGQPPSPGDVGISLCPGCSGSELERTTARASFWGTRAVVGKPRTFCFSTACRGTAGLGPFVGSACRRRTVMGRARRSGWTFSCASGGDFVEPTGSVVGPSEARHPAGAGGAPRARIARLGTAPSGGGAAANGRPGVGRAGLGRVGRAEDGGAGRAGRAVMVCALGVSGTSAPAQRCSAAVERSGSDSGVVSAGRGSGRASRRA
jgi:hypothetical protein